MLKIFQTLLLFFVAASLFAQSSAPNKKFKVSDARLDNEVTVSQNFVNKYYPTIHNKFAPAGNVPFPVNFSDYGTNGNAMRKLVVIGDTIIIGQDINPDASGPPPATTPTRIYYQVSYDGGTTWLSDALNISTSTSTRRPNIFPIYNSGLRSIVFCGRIYNGSVQGGLAAVETMLGLGSVSIYTSPITYRDYFGYIKNSTSIGGIVSTPAGAATDSLVYREFNYTTNTWGSKVLIAPVMDASFRYYCAINKAGTNVFAVWWRSASPSQAMMAYESTNGGTSFSSATVVMNAPTLINGDSCVAWFGGDVVYKPNSTQHGLAHSTLAWYNGQGSYSTREGSKIVYWSPNINGGNPVCIMDYHKYGFMNDTSKWNNWYVGLQVGVTPLSHASLAYSDDGTVLYCAFSAISNDTSAYSTGTNYNRNVIMICKSTDDGATWSDARYVAKDRGSDYLYPSLSTTGNTATTFNIVYNAGKNPGSFTFNDNAPIDTTYTIFKKGVVYNNLVLVDKVTIGIQNISSEVPESYSLMQNYPNPFNPATTIRFTLPKASSVTIKVYNIAGQLISTLANNETTSAGTKEVRFDGSNLSSGVYFYSIEAGSFKETKKMMLIK